MTRPRSGWALFRHVVGIAVTVVLVVAGLAGIAGFMLYAVAMNAWASNK